LDPKTKQGDIVLKQQLKSLEETSNLSAPAQSLPTRLKRATMIIDRYLSQRIPSNILRIKRGSIIALTTSSLFAITGIPQNYLPANLIPEHNVDLPGADLKTGMVFGRELTSAISNPSHIVNVLIAHLSADGTQYVEL
jgi:hypothetical protein